MSVAVSEMDGVVMVTLVKQGINEAPVSISVTTVDGTATGTSWRMSMYLEVLCLVELPSGI